MFRIICEFRMANGAMYTSERTEISIKVAAPSPLFSWADKGVVLIIETYRPWPPRRTSGRNVNKKNWRESETYRNFGKRFDWSLAIKHHIVMAAPIVETISLVNGFKRHIVIAAPFAVTMPFSVQNLKKSSNSSKRFDGKSRSLDDRG